MAESNKNKTKSPDVVLEVLASQRRRYTLYCLKKHEAPLALADVAEKVAVQENETPITEVSAKDVKRTYLSLYHNHVPKLEDASVVRYDQGADTVILSEQSELLEQLLGDAWEESYEPELLDIIFEVLADQRCRYALHYLKKHEAPLALADLAKEVATQESERTITEVSAKDVKRTYQSLYHSHIPKLEAANVVHYDQDRDIVTFSEKNELIAQYMESFETE